MKILFFLYPFYYYKYFIPYSDDNVFSFVPFDKEWVKRLFSLHSSWKLNKRRNALFISLWFNRCLKNMPQTDEVSHILMAEIFPLSYSIKFIDFLRKKYKSVKIVFLLFNPIDSYVYSKIEYIKDYYDGILTFNPGDSDKYGFTLFQELPFFPPILPVERVISDVFFIGSEKGRLDYLLAIYEKLTSLGLLCDFYIVNVPEEKQRYADRIHYNVKLSYENVLNHINQSRAILEILQKNEEYISIRTYEAYRLKKKLITSNHTIKAFPFYDDSIVSIINKPEDLNIEFFNVSSSESKYKEFDEFNSFDKVKKFLIDTFNV